jgi:hypothetical protein
VPAAASKPHNTLVTSRREAEDLRRRIGMPAALDLERHEPDAEIEADDLDEISFDENPLSGLDALPEPDGEPELNFEAPPPPHRAPAPPVRAAAPERSNSSPAKAERNNSRVVNVDIEPGQNEVTVPVEIELEAGSGPVTLNLKVVLRPRR